MMRLWDITTGRELRRFEGHNEAVVSAAFSPNGRFIVSASHDQTTRIWNSETGRELIRLVSFTNGTWVVATPEGHFDTNNLEEIKGLHWLISDDPLRTLPLEIFMRDYYEPRLLARVLAGEELREIPSLAKVNRAQPRVQIVSVERELGTSDTVRVTVEIGGVSQQFGTESERWTMTTGVYDLRLFRGGQLVGQWPAEPDLASKPVEEEREQWRTAHHVAHFEEGTKKVVLSGIRLPRLAGVKEVEFKAYAFNEDRVKSDTARFAYTVPPDLSPRSARAYLVTIGVNSFADASWNLNYAANDARRAGSVLKARLESLRDAHGEQRYEQVVWVPLVSDTMEEKPPVERLQATKAHIEAVLKTLAGQPVPTARLMNIPGAKDLRRVNPEDLVVIMISTHGVVDKKQGNFYFLPADIARCLLGRTGNWSEQCRMTNLRPGCGGLMHAIRS